MDYKTYLPVTPLIENSDFEIYGPKELEQFAKDSIEYITGQKHNILAFFKLEGFRKIRINLFLNHEDFINFTRQFYEPSSYCKSHFTKGMITCNIDESIFEDSKQYQDHIYTMAHEFVHLVYMERIQEKGDDTRVVWLDEGLAHFLSGKFLYLNDDDNFKEFLKNKILADDKELPEIGYLNQHGSKYGQFVDLETKKYNGYYVSLMIVKYLNDTMNKEEFLEMIKNKFVIDNVGMNVISDAVSFYKDKYNLKPPTF